MQLTEKGDKNCEWDKPNVCCDDRVWWQAFVLPSYKRKKTKKNDKDEEWQERVIE